jgi:hypothetical protein
MNPWLKRLFLITSIGGGFAGAAVTGSQFADSGQGPLNYALIGVVTLAYSVGIIGGIELIEDEGKGLRVLSWYYLAQVPYLISPVISYQFFSGLTLFGAVGSRGLTWGAYLGSRWLYGLFQMHDPRFEVGANAFGIWATWYLRWELGKKLASQSPDPEPAPAAPDAGQPPRQFLTG